MPGKREDILDVAEQMIRKHGYNGFSFRDIAAAVDVKSASVHYHFPTKADLAAAVAKRYRENFEMALAESSTSDGNPLADWRTLFRRALEADGLMCLCGILAVEGDDLPPQVAEEARLFMQDGIDAIANVDGFTREDGLRVLAQLEGAMLLARSLGDPQVFDQATKHLV
ncbi:MAG: helix-turn-helix domain-containing protein [Pseudomonadota bacterium]